MNIVDDKRLIVRCKDLLSTNLDDDVVVMNIDSGLYYGMEKTAQRIWDLLENAQTLESLISILSQEYKVEPAVCRADIQQFVQDLVEEGLVVTQ